MRNTQFNVSTNVRAEFKLFTFQFIRAGFFCGSFGFQEKTSYNQDISVVLMMLKKVRGVYIIKTERGGMA